MASSVPTPLHTYFGKGGGSSAFFWRDTSPSKASESCGTLLTVAVDRPLVGASEKMVG